MRFVTWLLCFFYGTVLSNVTDNEQHGYQFEKYQRYDTIKDYLQILSQTYPKLVIVEYPMHSSERREIPLVKISTNHEMENIIVFIEAGLHGREWLSTATAVYIIHELVENASNAEMISEIDWYIAPLTNPDGYEYSHLYVIVEDESFRKTKSTHKNCLGVDPNRNFDYQWTPNKECDDDFPGPRPFSEPETLFIKKQILSNQRRIKLYLSLHCCGSQILHSWGYTKELPDDINELLNIAQKVQKAINSVRETVYAVGSAFELTYLVSGNSMDWVKAVGKVNLSFTIELPGETGDYSVPTREILPIAQEFFEGLKVFHKDLVHKYVDN